LHEPNWQTVLQLKKIWKNIKNQLPEAEIHIYGAYATEKVFQLHNQKEGFIIKGRAENVETVFNKLKFYLHQFLLEQELKGNCSKVCNLVYPT
jgi:hypothetical protein